MKTDRLAGLMLSAAALSLAGPARAQSVSGEQLFKQRCGICHKVKAAEKSPLGPNLAGIVGRKAGSTAFNYSAALKGSKIVWNAATLDKFLAAPTKVVPGTRMVNMVSDAGQRKVLVGYLATVR